MVWATATGPTNSSKYMIWWKSEVGRLKGNVPRIVENPLMHMATATCKIRGLPQLVCSGVVAASTCPHPVHGNQRIHPIKSCRLASMWLWQDMLAVSILRISLRYKVHRIGEQLTHSVMKDVQLLQARNVLIKNNFMMCKQKQAIEANAGMKGNY